MDKKHYFISVKELVEWCFRSGDLGASKSFFNPKRAVMGIEGHKRIQSSRPDSYIAEHPVKHTFSEPELGFKWTIRGRADGFWKTDNSILIEEIKTVTPAWDGQAKPLHWAQAKIYAAIIAKQENLEEVEIQLTYLEIDTDTISVFRDSFKKEDLEELLQIARQEFRKALKEKHSWFLKYSLSTTECGFPYPKMRPGQVSIMECVLGAMENGTHVMIEAPTGLGKTMATLFPLIQFAGKDQSYLPIFLTARNTNKTNAEKAVSDIRKSNAAIKSLTLGAASDWCITEEHPCDTQACPYATGYFDRNRKALLELNRGLTHYDKETIIEFGKENMLCPSALSYQMSDWANIIIADYNHIFDPKAGLKQYLMEENKRKVILIVDEAHNLPERARSMFGSTLETKDLINLSKQLPKALSKLKKALKNAYNLAPEVNSGKEMTFSKLDSSFVNALEECKAHTEQLLIQSKENKHRSDVLDLYFNLSDFLQNYRNLKESDRLIVRSDSVEICCLDPKSYLESSFKRCHSIILMSATLSPFEYFKRWLPIGNSTNELSYPSPFPRENLKVWIEDGIQTTWRARQNTAPKLSRLLKRFIFKNIGSQLIFFPSYKYMDLVSDMLEAACDASIQFKWQKRNSPPEEQSEFIDFLSNNPESERRVGIAVLGGVFAEGIDIPNNAVKAVAVIGIGMPQICLERNLIQEHLEEELGKEEAFNYTYIYPGIIKVIQAVGRLLRSESDKGSALLIDTRYRSPEIQELIPKWWDPNFFQFK